MSARKIKLKRERAQPTDATGCGWAFFSLFFAIFFGQMSKWIGMVFLVAIPCCLVWQVLKWRDEWKTHRAALHWCREHYPDAGGTPIVDLMISLQQLTDRPVEEIGPLSPLDSLNIVLKQFEEDFLAGIDWSDGEHDLLYSICLGYDLEPVAFNPTEFNYAEVCNAIRHSFIDEVITQARIPIQDLRTFQGSTVDKLIGFVIEETNQTS